eukprot:CAMPEP_0170589964 /NCGR_PEP_ID=MMETSP0224-20130122/11620_1 /TAXON_ID=285029 /ORGANISM="Togula jolla, Strain CCCM 725" /LENGTH=335 /DNA_ID=CAMNT_0010913735 /DNA_START=71 /DNA_END=1076 /DNA_ORIENTATION=+
MTFRAAVLLTLLGGAAGIEPSPSSSAAVSQSSSLLYNSDQAGQFLRKERHLYNAGENVTVSTSLTSLGLEEGARYRIRLGKEVAGFAMQRSGWYLGAMRGSPKDERDENSLYVSAFKPGRYGFNHSETTWELHSVPGSNAVKISQPNGWYLTARNDTEKDFRSEDSSYLVVRKPETPGSDPDGGWRFEKKKMGLTGSSTLEARGTSQCIAALLVIDGAGRQPMPLSSTQGRTFPLQTADSSWRRCSDIRSHLPLTSTAAADEDVGSRRPQGQIQMAAGALRRRATVLSGSSTREARGTSPRIAALLVIDVAGRRPMPSSSTQGQTSPLLMAGGSW